MATNKPLRPAGDMRHIANGRIIPTASYSDQPYIVRTDDGAWLCCLTTGPGSEGAEGQHVITLRSMDRGATWSEPVAVEPGDRRENSYAVMLKMPSGRVYIFYNHNTDNVREVRRHDGQAPFSRVDSLGYYVFKFSDDHGKSWSRERCVIPVRAFQCDRDNVYGGAVRFFWNIGRPLVLDGRVCVPLHKVGRMGRGFFEQSEGALLMSPDLLEADDPAAAHWETLPDGEHGLRAPAGGGAVAEEQTICALSDGTLYCVYRTMAGFRAESYSRDGGRNWSAPRYVCFTDGRPMKHPRAATSVWRCANGRYLCWFHNHGGNFIGAAPNVYDIAYNDRNPAWLSAGVEVDTPHGREIAWSEPELALYDDDPFIRISYPDLIEDDGRYFLTETQKNIARVHEVNSALLHGMWETLGAELAGRFTRGADNMPSGCVASLPLACKPKAMARKLALPPLPHFYVGDHNQPDGRGRSTGYGITLVLTLSMAGFRAGRMLLDNRDKSGCGFALITGDGGGLEMILCDGQSRCHCISSPLPPDKHDHHVVVVIDGGPRIVSFVINGRFDDGGTDRQFGWSRFSHCLRHVNGAAELCCARAVRALAVYDRALATWEAIALYRHARQVYAQVE